MHRREDETGTAHTKRMAERNRAAMRIDEICIFLDAELAQHRNALRSESFVEFDQIDITDLETETFQQLAHRRHRADAHNTRSNTGRRMAEQLRTRRQAVLLHGFFRCKDDRRRTVIDARRIACGHRAVRAHDRLQLGEAFEGGFGARVFVLIHGDRTSLAAGNRNRRNFFREVTGCNRLARALLRTDREGVLIGTRDLIVGRDVFAGLRHGIDAVLLLHQRINEAPADGGVEAFHAALERLGRLAGDERCAGHGFHAARNGEIDFTGADRPRDTADRIEARGAKPVHRHARHTFRQARQQQRHARDVAVVFTGLIGAAIGHFVQRTPIRLRIALHQRLDRGCGKIVRAHLGQRSAEPSDRRTHRITDVNITHGHSP